MSAGCGSGALGGVYSGDRKSHPAQWKNPRMKATALDYLLSFVAITFLLVLSIGIVVGLSGWTAQVLRDYHVIADLALVLILYGVLSAVLLRVLLVFRPLQAGTYGEDSSVFTYWKLLTVVHRLGLGALRPFTPVFLLPVMDALFGAKIGSDVAFGGEINDPYLVTVGSGTTLGTHSIVTGSFTGGGNLTCAPVVLGERVTVGPGALISPGCEIGSDVTIVMGSYVMPNTKIPAGETWRGNPARKWIQTAALRARTDGD